MSTILDGKKKTATSTQMARVFRLALPLAYVQLGFHFTGFVDTALAGRYSEVALAATGLGTIIFFGVSVFGIGLAFGLDPVASQAFGAGENQRARIGLWQGVWMAGFVTLPLWAILVGIAYLLEFAGVDPELASETRVYIFSRAPSLFPLIASVSVRSYLQAAHRTRPIVIAVTILNLINFIADWLFVFGDEGLVEIGLPAMGIPR
ncbi:MATE family efflux transporter, partial [Myxococcota bacterium]|nr:MATE family efflux transporter [Myxococcota bacterium]